MVSPLLRHPSVVLTVSNGRFWFDILKFSIFTYYGWANLSNWSSASARFVGAPVLHFWSIIEPVITNLKSITIDSTIVSINTSMDNSFPSSTTIFQALISATPLPDILNNGYVDNYNCTINGYLTTVDKWVSNSSWY